MVECTAYLAGFEPLLLHLMSEAVELWPDIIVKHKQSLKRVWPQRNCSTYCVPPCG